MRIPRSRPTSRLAFTLLELIVAVAILAILAGAAVPVTAKVLTYKARQATRDELALLGEAASQCFRDTNILPGGIDDLLVDPGTAGWSGPYLPGVVSDQLSGQSGYVVDAWSRAYRYSISGNAIRLASDGEDAQPGSTDDLELDVDVTWIRRERTLDQLRILNQAILLYNGLYQTTDPLPANWALALNKLVLRGLLPTTSGYLTDAWGSTFVETPAGSAPVVRVTSPNVSPGS
jgi:prepilin-type N-terminal cleavage/methylation domain-containing protein